MMQGRADALVVGGGFAGSMVALELARAGRNIILLERSKGAHNKVCGEFLSSEAVHYLARHNIDLAALGAVPLHTLRFVLPTATIEQPLPFTAYSMTRRLLDEQLLRHSAEAGVDVQRNSSVEALEQQGETWAATLRDGRTLRARHAFLATGKHDLRGRPRPAGTHAKMVGFKMYYRLTPQQHAALGHAMELMLFPGGYAGMQHVEDGVTNLCFVVSAQRLHAVGSQWPLLLQHLLRHTPHLATRLQDAKPLLEAPLAASHIPYGHLQHTANDGLWRVGDQAAVIPSFCGDGMAIALHSGAFAAQCFLNGETPSHYQAQLSAQLGRRLGIATALSKLMVGFPKAAGIVRAFPALLKGIARMTRIPGHALLTTHNEDVYRLVGR